MRDQLHAAIAAAGRHAGVRLEVAVAVEASCPRCGGTSSRYLPEPTLPMPPGVRVSARRCRCGHVFRLLQVPTSLVREILEQPPRAAPVPATAAAAAQAEIDDSDDQAAAAALRPEDLELAARALQGWRVRLAAVRTEKLIVDEMEPLPEDLALLERAVAAGTAVAPSPA